MELERGSVSEKVGESSSSKNTSSSSNDKEKAVIVRVKRKAAQSPLEALWLEINERPLKRPVIDFQKLSISASSSKEELKVKRVLVQHVETVCSSEASLHFLQSFVRPDSDNDSKFKAGSKERRRALLKDNKHDHLLSKAKQDQKELAKSARFEQIWKRRTRNKESIHDEALGDVCRVYDVLRVDMEEASGMDGKQEDISVEDEEILSKFLPLLRECVPGAAAEIEYDFSSRASRLGSTDEYVYDLYAVKDQMDEPEASYPFPLVQVDDDDQFFDGLDDSDYETDDSNAENHPRNDYPEEESSDEEEKSETTVSESEEEEGVTESDTCSNSYDSVYLGRSEDPLYVDEMDENYNDDSHHGNSDDGVDGGDGGEDWRWAYR